MPVSRTLYLGAAAAAAICAIGTFMHWSDIDAGPRTTVQVTQLINDHAKPAFLADWTGALALISAVVAALAAGIAARSLHRAPALVAGAASAVALVAGIVGATRLDHTSSDHRLDDLTSLAFAYHAAAGLYLSVLGAAAALICSVAAVLLAREPAGREAVA
jgi:hypothetical protein